MGTSSQERDLLCGKWEFFGTLGVLFPSLSFVVIDQAVRRRAASNK